MRSSILDRSLASILVFGCLAGLVGLLSYAHPALAQTQEDCPLPPGVTPPAEPRVTAQQVENGSATLMEFALAARDQFSRGPESREQVLYVGCLIRHDGSHWHAGSTYLVQLTPDGRVFVHTKNMALSGRLLNPLIYGAILQALGINPADLLADPSAAAAAFAAAAAGDGGAFDIPNIPDASGYAAVYFSGNFRIPLVLLAGFDLNETHLAEEEIDYGDPAVTARDVVDRETLKAFVTQAGEAFLKQQKSGDLAATSKARVALRDPNGPWRHGSVYLYVLDLTTNIVLFHGAFPDRFELRPLVGIARDGVTGELILPQVIEAAKSSPDGGFVEYFYDDPADDTDSADIPKVGYARQFTGSVQRAGGTVLPLNFIFGSGFYGRLPYRAVLNILLTRNDQPVANATVEFSRSISGRVPEYQWQGKTNDEGRATIEIQSNSRVSGYYLARAKDADGNTLDTWGSIPVNDGKETTLSLPVGGRAQSVRTASQGLTLHSNVPNPFNPSTQIAYQIPEAGHVTLAIYNTLGQQVRVLVRDSQVPGHYRVTWDGTDTFGRAVSSGVYVYRLSHPGGVITRQLLLVK